MSENCIFCQIVEGSLPADIIYQDDNFIAINDINPKANVHVLVIPKTHIESLEVLESAHCLMLGQLTLLLPQLAKAQGLDDGFRTIINTGPGGGQEVPHLHYHILGGGFHG